MIRINIDWVLALPCTLMHNHVGVVENVGQPQTHTDPLAFFGPIESLEHQGSERDAVSAH